MRKYELQVSNTQIRTESQDSLVFKVYNYQVNEPVSYFESLQVYRYKF